MKQHLYRIASVGLATILAGGLVGCQEVDQPKTTLTQKQWQEVKANLLDEKPNTDYPIGAKFGDKIELIGFDVSKPLEAGKKATFTWYWKALDDIEDNWKVFVHFDSSKRAYRQNLDHQPLDGLYQTGRWKKGQIIKDVQQVTIDKNYPGGQAVPYIGFFKKNQRLPIANDVKKTNDRRVIGPPLTVKNTSTGKGANAGKAKLPTYMVPTRDAKSLEGFKLDGKLDDKVWADSKDVGLQSFGAAPNLNTKVHVFRTEDALYIGAMLPDENVWSELKDRDSNTWTEEVFEVYIDKDRDGKDYMELQINPLGTIFDAHFAQRLGRGKGSRDEQINRAKSWNMQGLETAIHVDGTVNDKSDKDKSWSVEIKLPFEGIPGVDREPKDGESWAANFYRYDRPAKGDKRTYAYAWSKPNGGSFHQVERFGNLHFGHKQVVTKRAATAQKAEGSGNAADDEKPAVKRLQKPNIQQLRQIKLNNVPRIPKRVLEQQRKSE